MVSFDTKLVVPAPEVLDEGVTTNHDRRGPICSQSALRSESRLETAVIGLDPVVIGYEMSGSPVWWLFGF